MNERIDELAEQARNYALDEKRIYERVHNTEQCMEEYREVYNRKFAELIVRECAKVCSEVEDTYGNLNKIDIAVGAGVCVSEIKQHFGVEE